MEHKRQGDVLLAVVDMTPEAALEAGRVVARVNGRIIIKAGEQTGHHHAIRDLDVQMIELTDMRVIVARRAFDVFHEEHAVAHFEPGVYALPEQVEYTPEVTRPVLD